MLRFFETPCTNRNIYEPRNWYQWKYPCFYPWVLTPVKLSMFSSTDYDTFHPWVLTLMKLTLFSFTRFDTNAFYIVFIHGFSHQSNQPCFLPLILTPMKLTLFSCTGYLLWKWKSLKDIKLGLPTKLKPSDCWQSTRSKVVRNTEMGNL